MKTALLIEYFDALAARRAKNGEDRRRRSAQGLLGDAMGVSRATITNWKQRGEVPALRVYQLREKYPGIEVELDILRRKAERVAKAMRESQQT